MAALAGGGPLAALAATAALANENDTPAPISAAQDPVWAAVAMEDQMIALVNADRAANGLSVLPFDESLLRTAEARASEQLAQGALSHYDADGTLAFTRLLAADGVTYLLAGENLAQAYGADLTTAARIETALMNSPTHRANILEPTFDAIAVGTTTNSQGQVIVAQIFRRRGILLGRGILVS
jgi:uncharacterized protein YkwD